MEVGKDMNYKKIVIILVACAFLLFTIAALIIIFSKNQPTNQKKHQKEEYSINTSNDREKISKAENFLNIVDSIMVEYYPIENFQKITSNQKTEFLINILSVNSNGIVTKKMLEESKSNYFSTKTKLVYKTFETSKYSFKYISSKQQYLYNVKNSRNYRVQTNVINEKIDENKNLKIEKAIFFVEATYLPNIYPQKVYATIEDAINQKNEIYIINNNSEELNVEENFNKIKNKLQIYQYKLKEKKQAYKIYSISKKEDK